MIDLKPLYHWIRRNWLGLLPFLILITMNVGFMLLGWLAMFPPGTGNLRPAVIAYNWLGALSLRIGSVLCLSALPLLLIGLFWALRRFSKQEIWQDDIRIARFLAVILFLILIFLLPLAISSYLLPDFVYPGQLASATTDLHRYYLDVHEGSDTAPDVFFLQECDRNGIICERILRAPATAGSGWNREVQLIVRGESLLIESNGGRIIYERFP